MINYSVNGELTLNTAQFDKEIMKAAQKLEKFNNLAHNLGKDLVLNERVMNDFKKVMGLMDEITHKEENAAREAKKLKAQLDNLFNGGERITDVSRRLTAAKQLANEESLIAKEKAYQEKINKELVTQGKALKLLNDEMISQEEKLNALRKSRTGQTTLDAFANYQVKQITAADKALLKYNRNINQLKRLWLEGGKATSDAIRRNISDITRLQIATAKAQATALYNTTIIPNPSISQSFYNQIKLQAQLKDGFNSVATSVDLLNNKLNEARMYNESFRQSMTTTNVKLLETTSAVALLGTGIKGLLTSGVSGLLGMAQNFTFPGLDESNVKLIQMKESFAQLSPMVVETGALIKTQFLPTIAETGFVLKEAFSSSQEGSNKFKESFRTASEEAKNFGNSTKESVDRVKLSFKEAMDYTIAYINTMRQIQSATRGSVGALSQLGMAAQTAQKRTEGLSYSLRRLKSLMTLAATILVWDFAFGLIETTSETFKAKSEMESYYNVLGWTTIQQQSFNQSLDKTVSQFARINKFQLGETLTSLGVEFDLSSEQLEKASNVVPMVMNEYLRAGRTTDEAVLAVKDIMQGEFTRLSRETGVGKEELQSYGWSGDTTDIDTLMTALGRAGSARHWDVFASKASSLNDVLLISQNRFSEFATMVMSVFTPLILAGFNSVIGAFDGLISAFQNMNGIDDVIVTGGTAFVTFRLLIGALGVLKSKTKEWIIVREANLLGINAEQAKLQGLNTTYAASLMAQEQETLTKEKEIFDRYANIVATEQETLAKEAGTLALKNDGEMRNLCNMGIEKYIENMEASSFAQTQETFATLENATAKEKLALAIETETLIKESSIDLDAARTLGIEAQTIETFKLASAEEIRRKMLLKAQLAEVKGWKITTARILNLEMETLAEGGLTNAIFQKITANVGEKISEESSTTALISKRIATLLNIDAEYGLRTALFAKIFGLEASTVATEIEAFATAEATVQTEMFTVALLSNPVFLGVTAGIVAITIALSTLASVTGKARANTQEYNRMLQIADDSSTEYSESTKKLAQNIKKYNTTYTAQSDYIISSAKGRILAIKKENDALSEQEKAYEKLYGTAYGGVLDRDNGLTRLQELEDANVYLSGKYTELAKKSNVGYTDKEATDIGTGIGGWRDWEARSYKDYLETDDFMIQIETLAAAKLAKLGGDLSTMVWDFLLWWGGTGIDSEWLNQFFQNLFKGIENLPQQISDWINEHIVDPIKYYLNPVNWFSGMFVSAADGSGGSGGLTAEDWKGFFGLVDSTKQAIKNKLKEIVDTITWYLNPLNWISDAGNGIITWWNTNIADPLNGVLSIFGIDLHVKGEEAGTNLKNGVQSGSSGTSQAVKGNLDPVTGMLDTFKSTVGWLGRKLGLNLKSNVKTGSEGTHLPVVDEMNDILSSIQRKSGDIWTAAYNTAKGIVGWIAKGLERKSPGASARMTLQEMKDIEMFMVQQQPNLYASAKATGQTIVQGMHDANLSNMQSGQSVAFGLNKATLSNTTSTYNKLDGVVTNAFNGLDSTIDSTGVSVANNLTTMSDSAKTSFTDMSTDVSSLSLTNDQYLSAMKDSTVLTTIQMANAWSIMKDRIVTVASQIRSQSYDKFNSLHKTIASFYNQLASAHFTAGLAAGSPFSRGTNNYRTRSPRRYSSGVAGGTGLANIPMKHTKKIMDTAYPWKIADPWFLGIQIPMDNRVGDFKDGNSKRISYDSFEGILAKILTARGFRDPSSYEFYWNSKKTNQQVWDSVGCNCYDGAEMIIEIAQMLGLDGSLVHGSWNGLGHMGAMIGGKLYDMTQFQKHGVFRGTKGVVFGTNSGTSRYTSGAGRVSNSQTQTVVENKTVVNVDLSNARIYGIDDLDDHIDKSIRKSIIKLHGNNPATGV